MSFCINCGTELDESDCFCINCGCPATDDANYPPQPDIVGDATLSQSGNGINMLICKSCGAQLMDGDTFCFECGAACSNEAVYVPSQEPETIAPQEPPEPPVPEANEISYEPATVVPQVAIAEPEPALPDIHQQTLPANNLFSVEEPAPTQPVSKTNDLDNIGNAPLSAGKMVAGDPQQKRSPHKLSPVIIAALAAAPVIIVVLLIGIFSGWFVVKHESPDESIDSAVTAEIPTPIAPAATQSGGGASTQPMPSPETPPPVSAPVSPSEPDISPKPEPAAAPVTPVDWKQLYFEEMQAAIAYRDGMNQDDSQEAMDNHDLEGRYPRDLNGFMLADLNFDGVPELIIYGDGNYEADIPGMKFFTITRNGVVKFFEGTADPPGNRYNDELGSPEFNWQLYRKKTDGSFVYMFCGENGSEMQANYASIYSSDKSTMLDSSFAETAKMADLLERYDDQLGTQSWYFNGNEVTKDEYIRHRSNLLAGYEPVQYTFSTLIKRDYLPEFSNSELWTLLDSYVPEEDYVQIVGAGAEINVQADSAAVSDNEGYANPPSNNNNAAPEPQNLSLSNVIFSTNNWIRLCICWENGTTTVFERDRDSSVWTMESRDGNYRIVDPGFTDEITAFTISFPTTSAKYRLLSDNTGSFNGESMTWYFETDPNFSNKSANGTEMTEGLGDALGRYLLISIKVLWYDGDSSILYKQSNGSWMMKDRSGSFSSASPKFSRSPGFVTMSFPSSSAQYTFYDNGAGTYAGENFNWFYDYSDR